MSQLLLEEMILFLIHDFGIVTCTVSPLSRITAAILELMPVSIFRLAAILELMSVLTFITVVFLYLSINTWLFCRLIKASIECESVQSQQCEMESLSSKVVDFRREQGVLRDLHYLSGKTERVVQEIFNLFTQHQVYVKVSPPVQDQLNLVFQ
jgi:hypothetical protein